MATARYLAMTASEFHTARFFPPKIGWMACHFSPYGSGLCNLPDHLPEGSLLILNDRIPTQGHDTMQITDQLLSAVQTLRCSCVLLDFQHPGDPVLKILAQNLTETLPCPLVVSEQYARDLSCSVFLSPCPHHVLLADHAKPWQERELWLDLALDAEVISLAGDGAVFSPVPYPEITSHCHVDSRLHCHYSIVNTENTSRFTLWRTREDLEALLHDAEELGICTFVGLYQELCDFSIKR